MFQQAIKILPVFTADDQAWIRRTSAEVPPFWSGHLVEPTVGDVLRVGGRQFVIQARVWDHEAGLTTLRLFLSSSHARSDTTFG